jgi:hypothetical protein
VFLSGFFEGARERWGRGLKQKLLIGLVALMVFYAFAASLIRLRGRYEVKRNYLEISDIIRQNSLPDDRILVISKGETEVIYYSRRRGFHVRFAGDIDREMRRSDHYAIAAVTDYSLPADFPDAYAYLTQNCDLVYSGPAGMVFKYRK